jgi:hypothetical protein
MHGLGLHEDQGALPVWPQTTERDPERAVRFGQFWAFGLALQNSQLLSQCEVLEGELTLRPEARSGGREQGVHQVKHWVGQPDAQCGNVNDSVVDGVLRRYTAICMFQMESRVSCSFD